VTFIKKYRLLTNTNQDSRNYARLLPYLRTAARIQRAAQAIWYGLGMLGCEEEAVNGRVRLKCYFTSSASLHTAEFHLMDLNPCQPITISVVKDEDWNAKWKQSMRPVQVAEGSGFRRLAQAARVFGPEMDKNRAENGLRHRPPRNNKACLQALAGQIGSTGPAPAVLDIGTGSGILCFVADHMKTSFAAGLDVDPVCASNSRKTCEKTPRVTHFICHRHP